MSASWQVPGISSVLARRELARLAPRILLRTLLVVFACEVVTMRILHWLGVDRGIATDFLDASLLTVLSVAPLYWLVFRPVAEVAAKAAVAPAEARFQAVVEAVSDAIVITEADGAIAFANPAAEPIFGFELKKLLGWPLSVLLPRGARLGRTEAEGCRRDGSRFPAQVSTPLLGGRRRAGPPAPPPPATPPGAGRRSGSWRGWPPFPGWIRTRSWSATPRAASLMRIPPPSACFKAWGAPSRPPACCPPTSRRWCGAASEAVTTTAGRKPWWTPGRCCGRFMRCRRRSACAPTPSISLPASRPRRPCGPAKSATARWPRARRTPSLWWIAPGCSNMSTASPPPSTAGNPRR